MWISHCTYIKSEIVKSTIILRWSHSNCWSFYVTKSSFVEDKDLQIRGMGQSRWVESTAPLQITFIKLVKLPCAQNSCA